MNHSSTHENPKVTAIFRLLQPLFSASAAIVVLKDDEVGELEMPELRHRIIFNPMRRQSFIAGRVAARSALKALGMEPEPIPVLPSQAPQWPAGVVGSITHAKGYTAVVVERKSKVHSVGVDLQDLRVVRPDLLERIASAEEIASLRMACRGCPESIPHVAFATKEAIFKALPQEMQQGLAIGSIRVSIPGFGRFQVESVNGTPFQGWEVMGRFSLNHEFVAAGCSLLSLGADA